MEAKVIHNSSKVYEFLKDKIRYNYIYQFSDLSPEQWENAICYGLYEDGKVKAIAMEMMNYSIPVLLAAGFENQEYSKELVGRIKEYLPPKFYTHMDGSVLESVFSQDEIFDLEEYMNMGLCSCPSIDKRHQDEAVRLGFKDLKDIKELLDESYPGAWLDEELVKLNENFGIFIDGKLISFAGIHAYSEENQVAAVAHVTTHPDYRNRGYGKKVVGALVSDLKDKIKFIGLNVKVENLPAISCYKKLGFEESGRFVACEIRRR